MFTYIYHEQQPNVGEYTIRRWYWDGNGVEIMQFFANGTTGPLLLEFWDFMTREV